MNKPPLAEILVRQFGADVGKAMQYMAEHDCEWEVALVISCPNFTPSGIARELLTPAARDEYYHKCAEIFVRLYHEQTNC